MRLSLRSACRRSRSARWIAGLALAAAPLLAQADQYAYITVQQAAAGLSALAAAGPEARAYCAPCGDGVATPLALDTLGIEPVWDHAGSAERYRGGGGEGYWEVLVDGEGVDLAYVYIRTDAGWENLAMHLGLEPVQVPRLLTPAQAQD